VAFTNEDINYSFSEPLKGHIAYFDNRPFSIYFNTSFHTYTIPSNPNMENNPVKFGLVSLPMDDISMGNPQTLDKIQLMHEDINSLFGIASMTYSHSPSENQYTRSYNIDSDDKNNIYLAFFETFKARTESDMYRAA
jgi:hypothetical protein